MLQVFSWNMKARFEMPVGNLSVADRRKSTLHLWSSSFVWKQWHLFSCFPHLSHNSGLRSLMGSAFAVPGIVEAGIPWLSRDREEMRQIGWLETACINAKKCAMQKFICLFGMSEILKTTGGEAVTTVWNAEDEFQTTYVVGTWKLYV